MRQLLWKDYRLNRPLLILGAAIFGGLYLTGIVTEITASWPTMPEAKSWAGLLASYGTVAMLLTSCITGLLGGNAIACERADRSAHFLAYLPPTKWQILGSKLIVAASATAVIWAWLLLSLYVVVPWLSPEPTGLSDMLSVTGAAAMCVLTFGVGWLCSACMEKTVVPCVMALVSPIGLSLLLLAIFMVCGVPRFEMSQWAGPVSFCVGVVAFFLGTWTYVRRVEP